MAELFTHDWRRRALCQDGKHRLQPQLDSCLGDSVSSSVARAWVLCKARTQMSVSAHWRCPGLVVSASSSPQPDSQTWNFREVTMHLGALMPPSELEEQCRFLGQGSSQTELGLPGKEHGRLGPQSPPNPTLGDWHFTPGFLPSSSFCAYPTRPPGSVPGGHWAPACSFISSWVWGQPVSLAEVGPSYL